MLAWHSEQVATRLPGAISEFGIRQRQDVVRPVAVRALRAFGVAQIRQCAVHAHAVPRVEIRMAVAAAVRFPIAERRRTRIGQIVAHVTVGATGLAVNRAARRRLLRRPARSVALPCTLCRTDLR